MEQEQTIKEFIKADLRRQEGVSTAAYQDSLGYWTIGVGRLIDTRKGSGLTLDEVNLLLDNDVERCYRECQKELPFFDRLAVNQRRALVNMAFQMGVSGLLKFKRLLAAVEAGDNKLAWREGMSSLWAKQTPKRAMQVLTLLCEIGEEMGGLP